MGRVKITFPPLHPGQCAIRDDTHRWRVAVCGRRWGKTRGGAAIAVAAMLQEKRVWWVAPSYRIGLVGWRDMLGLARNIPQAAVRLSDRSLVWGKGSITLRSADNPNALRSEGLDLVILDEAAYTDEEAWEAALRPALMDRQGSALFLTSPRGKNWIYRLFTRPDVAHWQFPTWTNPYIVASEIEETRATMSERLFRQEVGADFVDFEGRVFPELTGLIEPEDRPTAGRTYAFGIDWGRSVDYTVVAVACIAPSAVVHIARMQGSYSEQLLKVLAMYRAWQPQIVVAEANAAGQAVIDELLHSADMPIEAFQTTATSKPPLIDGLAVALERGELRLPRHRELESEFANYSVRSTPQGRLVYEALPGEHDDIVMAVALAWHGAGMASDPFTIQRARF